MGNTQTKVIIVVSGFVLGLICLSVGLGCKKESNLSNEIDLTGIWVGSGTFTNNCANPACRYEGTMNPPSVTLDLLHVFNKVDGTTTIDLPQGEVLIAGNPCGPLYGQVEIFDGTVNGTRLTLTSYSGGAQQTWDLTFTSDLMRGSFLSDVVGCSGLKSDDIVLSRR